MLVQVLRGLVSVGLLEQDVQGRYLLTPVGAALAPMRGAALVRGNLYYETAARLASSVVEGGVAFRRTYSADFFEHWRAIRTSPRASSTPGLTGILVDRPVAVDGARQRFAAAGLEDRTECVVGDFFAELPSGHDAYLLSRVLYDWSDADALRILRSCRRAVPDHGRVLVVDALLPDRVTDAPGRHPHGRAPDGAVRLPGAHRGRVRRVVVASGFTLRSVHLSPSPTRLAVLEAVPV